MAARKKANTDLQAQVDPKAPLDGAALLSAAKPVLALLNADLLERADNSPEVTRALKERHAREQKQERTADDYNVWRRNFVEQVAAAWFLSVVFVRTLEDRGLLERNRIAGSGALDSQKNFFALAPSLTERDYLLTVFRELAQLPAAAELFDTQHNPVWLLGPSAAATQQLLQLFRTPNDLTPAFRFGGDTRFLGDLYQDVSENVRKRYELLQTPRFVESFILDQTLEPAIERFGLSETTLIDPTCGSGHFLLGAFERLLDHRLSAEPGVDVRQAARQALEVVAGSDINPYAVAIARFRLTLAFLERAGYTKLKDAPGLNLNLVVADSLLHNPQKGLEQATRDSAKYQQRLLGEAAGADLVKWEDALFELEDPKLAYEVLGKRYAAVVGNPPYIVVQDAKLRERYRAMYSRTAGGKYSLAAPFCERFFQLGRLGAFVGMITANSFMKREFGKKLIQEYLPEVNLTSILNTSGAYVPGHGTPTVLLFGTAESPMLEEVLTVLANRGEPSTPDDAEQGLVWRSIADHFQEVGFENEYVSVTRTPRDNLRQHPWSLGGGGATELKALLEDRAEKTLGNISDSIGFMAITGEDEVFVTSGDTCARYNLPSRAFGIGEVVRDWAISEQYAVIFPYDDFWTPQFAAPLTRWLWPYRVMLKRRLMFGKTQIEAGFDWREYRHVGRDKIKTPLSITFAFVATHNHFVLDRGGKVFKQSAPIIKLPASATEDDHYALLAYLNSSTACFWMKQVFYPKATSVGDVSTEKGKPEANRYEFAGTGLKALPIPTWSDTQRQAATALAKEASELAQRAEQLAAAAIARGTAADNLAIARNKKRQIEKRLRTIQEDLDWLAYAGFGLTEAWEPTGNVAADDRLVESMQQNEQTAITALFVDRQNALRGSSELRLVEDPMYKRPWLGRQGVFGSSTRTDEQEVSDALEALAQDIAEKTFTQVAVQSSRDLRRALESDPEFTNAQKRLRVLGENQNFPTLAASRLETVPFLAAYRYTAAGLEKHAAWQHTWDLQRKEDAGESIPNIPVPPKYDHKDFASPSYWSHRGKLDVPKERFISYPGCESDEDGEPVYGWAGWNHRQRAVALATLYTHRKREEGWKKDRLQPMLAGLLELLPWLKQWHNEPDEDFDGAVPAVQFAQFLDAECSEHGFTHEDLRNWRPSVKSPRAKAKVTRNGSATKAAEMAAETSEGTTESSQRPKASRKSRSKKAAPAL
jgi:hypothetical protein